MLVDKVFREDGVEECLYKSSNILMSEWNPKNSKLTIVFNYGGKYQYSNVNHKDYLRFEADESQGKVFNKHIKHYKTDNLGKVDVKVLTERLNNLLNGTVQKISEGDSTEGNSEG
jgi:hypothetical protein